MENNTRGENQTAPTHGVQESSNPDQTQTPAQQAEEMAQKMKQEAMKVKDTGHKVWLGLTKWERVITAGALLGLATIVMPWASAYRESIWGWQVFWESYLVIPASLIAVLALIYFSQGASRKVRLLRSRWIVVIASFWLGIIFVGYQLVSELMGLASMFGSGPSFSIGALLIVIAVPVMLVGGLKYQSSLLEE